MTGLEGAVFGGAAVAVVREVIAKAFEKRANGHGPKNGYVTLDAIKLVLFEDREALFERMERQQAIRDGAFRDALEALRADLRSAIRERKP